MNHRLILDCKDTIIRDGNNQCPRLAYYGICRKDPKRMFAECPRSCNACNFGKMLDLITMKYSVK